MSRRGYLGPYTQPMEQYPPQDWTTPTARRTERAKPARRKLKLSKEATDALDEMRAHLDKHSAWLESTTGSVIFEFLCWHYHQSRSMGESPGFKGFRPKTRRGRPAGPNHMENFRPAHARKAAGLSKTEARLGPKPPAE